MDADTNESHSLDRVLEEIEAVEGWMTDAQAARLWELAQAVDAGGQIVEIGSYRGRSAIVLAKAARPDVTITAIDPHGGNDRGPQQIEGQPAEGQADHEQFLANLEAAGVRDRIRHVRAPSGEAADEVNGGIDFLYIDGAHRFRPARTDIVDWGGRVAPGGALAIHDSFSSVGVTLALLTTLVFGREFRYEGRDTSLALYRRQRLRGRARMANAARQVTQLAGFAWNVLLKVLILARMRPLVRRLGHDPDVWPH